MTTVLFVCVCVCVSVCVPINAKLRATLNAKNYHQMHRRTDAWFRLEMLRIFKERTNCTVHQQCAHLLQFRVLPSPSSQYCGICYSFGFFQVHPANTVAKSMTLIHEKMYFRQGSAFWESKNITWYVCHFPWKTTILGPDFDGTNKLQNGLIHGTSYVTDNAQCLPQTNSEVRCSCQAMLQKARHKSTLRISLHCSDLWHVVSLISYQPMFSRRPPRLSPRTATFLLIHFTYFHHC